MTQKTILITGAGSGFGKAAAIGMARNGHNIIATCEVSPMVFAMRAEVEELGLSDKIRVERLDLHDPYDIKQAQGWDFDILWNNAGRGEPGPVWEIPVDIVRRNYENNVFLPLELTQGVVQRWIREGKSQGKKVVFTSSMGGLFTPANWGTYVSTKHALEAFAEAMQQELAGYGVKVRLGAAPIGGTDLLLDAVADYRLPWLAGVSVDTRIVHEGRRAANAASTLHLPARTTVDLGARYRTRVGRVPVLFRAQLKNAGNVYGWRVSSGGGFTLLQGRRAVVSAVADF